MNGSAHDGAALECGPATAVPPVVLTDLERFWPSRRGHAFDEFCLRAR